MTCLACGQDKPLVRHFDDGGYCHDCNPTDEEWAREVSEIAAAQAELDGSDFKTEEK